MYDFLKHLFSSLSWPAWGERVLKGKDLGDIEAYQQKLNIPVDKGLNSPPPLLLHLILAHYR